MNLEILIEMEKNLEAEEFRSSREKLENLLHPKFKEVLSTGAVWNREQVIEALLKMGDVDDYNVYDFETFELGSDTGMVIFKTANNDKTKVTQRSSTWKFEDGKWMNIFHHATTVKV